MPRYMVVQVHGRKTEPVLNGDKLMEWGDAESAAFWAQNETCYTGIKHQVRPIIEDNNWKERELKRFATGHYTKLPWHNEPWVSKIQEYAHHFAHVGRNNPANIAFTLNETNAIRDVKTSLRPARYLARFYSSILTEEQIRSQVAIYKKLHDKDNVLHFACTDKEIIRVYEQGPRSCMQNPPKRSKIHPVAVYAGPDLAVAYAEKSGHIVARTVVWPKKKIYSRIYGDDFLLGTLLEDEGYQPGSLQGARLTKIKQGNRYICPYIDGVRQIKVGKKYLYIDKYGKRYAGNQDGFCGQGFNCAFCRTEHDLLKAEPHNVNGQVWCISCFTPALEKKTIELCAFSGHYYLTDQMVHIKNRNARWYRGFVDNSRAFKCSSCKENYALFKEGGRVRIVPHPLHEVKFDKRTGRNVLICIDCGVRQKELPFDTAN